MSRAANDWAWKQEIKPASLKLLLLAMSDRADEEHCCFPSIQRLEKDTGLNRKTIISNIDKLEDMGVLSDTGKRKGKTGRTKVYRLNLEFNSTENGTVPKTGPLTLVNSPENGTLNGPKNGTLNGPKNGTQNQSIEPVKEPERDLSDSGESNSRLSQTPYQTIWDLYQTILVNTGENQDRLVNVRTLTETRKRKIKKFWSLMKRDIKGVEDYFQWIWENREDHRWLFGNNTRGWVAEIEYLCREDTLAKARENRLNDWTGGIAC